ncbi:hypothetical protein Gotur_014960 [Gossypium turneri]
MSIGHASLALLLGGYGRTGIFAPLIGCRGVQRRLSKFSTVGIINALQLAREALLLDLPRERRWQKQKAKLWGILDGVALAQDRQHDRVLVQKDNMEVMGTIKEYENMETDSIPKMAFGREEGLQLFETSPLVPF